MHAHTYRGGVTSIQVNSTMPYLDTEYEATGIQLSCLRSFIVIESGNHDEQVWSGDVVRCVLLKRVFF